MADNKNRQALSDGSLDEVSGGFTKGRVDLSGVDIYNNKTGELIYTVPNKKKNKVMKKNKLAGMIDAFNEAAKLDQELNQTHLG